LGRGNDDHVPDRNLQQWSVTALPLMRGPQLVSRMAELIQMLAVVLGVLGVVTKTGFGRDVFCRAIKVERQ